MFMIIKMVIKLCVKYMLRLNDNKVSRTIYSTLITALFCVIMSISSYWQTSINMPSLSI